MSWKELRDSKVLAHLEWKGGSCKLELENVTVVIDLLCAYNFELCLDGRSELSGDLLEIRRVAELVSGGLLRTVEPGKEEI